MFTCSLHEFDVGISCHKADLLIYLHAQDGGSSTTVMEESACLVQQNQPVQNRHRPTAHHPRILPPLPHPDPRNRCFPTVAHIRYM